MKLSVCASIHSQETKHELPVAHEKPANEAYATTTTSQHFVLFPLRSHTLIAFILTTHSQTQTPILQL